MERTEKTVILSKKASQIGSFVISPNDATPTNQRQRKQSIEHGHLRSKFEQDADEKLKSRGLLRNDTLDLDKEEANARTALLAESITTDVKSTS